MRIEILATDNLSDEQITDLRLASADYLPDGGPYWFTETQLDRFFVMENCDLDQAAARAMESRAAMLNAGLGGFSSQGITVNAESQARGLLVEADRLRQSYRRA